MSQAIYQTSPAAKGQKSAEYLLQKRTQVVQFAGAPKVSIITVTFNSAATLTATLESVKKQSYQNIEHIIIDGCSTDTTLNIARSFSHISKIVSEKDKGIYDAMNKGLALASGDIIGFLNSDDVYTHAGVIAQVVEKIQTSQADTVYGDLQYVDSLNNGVVLRKWKSGVCGSNSFKYGWMPPHPTFFAKKEVYTSVGGFNLGLSSSADYELMLRILHKYRFTTSYLKDVLVKMKAGGASNGSVKKHLAANQEDRLAWKLNNLKPYFFTLYLKPLRKLPQYLNMHQLSRIPVVNMFL